MWGIHHDVNIPPLAFMLFSVHCDVRGTVDSIAELIDALIFGHAVARLEGVLHLAEGNAELF